MSHVTDKQEARKIVVDAFDNLTAGDVVVPVGDHADKRLCNQLGIKNVRHDLVQTIVNELVCEGKVRKTEDRTRPSISTVGDPKPQKAFRYEPVC